MKRPFEQMEAWWKKDSKNWNFSKHLCPFSMWNTENEVEFRVGGACAILLKKAISFGLVTCHK